MAALIAPPPGSFPVGKDAVVGIDLGTACSGISLLLSTDISTINAYTPSKVLNLVKEPTVMLLNGNAWTFGLGALLQFKNIVLDDPEYITSPRLRLFQSFKLDLLKCDGMDEFDEVVVAAKNSGCQGLLLDVYTNNLKTLKELALSLLQAEFGREFSPEDVMWMVTIPACMCDWAKGFMREAAFLAGITNRATKHSSQHIQFLLEPEAAAAAVAHNYNVHGSTDASLNPFALGKRFIVLDCGGGTVDISAHVVESVGPLRMRSLAAPKGVKCGSEKVNIQFRKFLVGLLKSAGIEEVTTKRQGEFIQVMDEFEALKVDSSRQDQSRINLKALFDDPDLPEKDQNAKRFNDAVASYNTTAGPLSVRFVVKNASLLLPSPVMTSFFEPILGPIVQCAREVLNETIRRGTPAECIAVVGGFSVSPVLRDCLTSEFGDSVDLKLVFPAQSLHPQAAVVVGAARIGSQSGGVIVNRFPAYTYGIKFAGDKFKVLVRAGEDVPQDSLKEFAGYPPDDADTECVWSVYRSEKQDPPKCSDETFVGLVKVPVPPAGREVNNSRVTKAQFQFGTVDIRVKVTSTTATVEKSLEFTRR